MIEKELARSLLPLVNGEDYGLLQEYVKSRQSIIMKALPYAVDINDIRDMQGAYKELGMLEKLREWVLQDSKNEGNK